MIFTVNGLRSGYQNNKLAGFYDQIRENIERIPGVQAATFSSAPLIGDSVNENDITISGSASRTANPAMSYVMTVGNHFFETMGIPILLGRAIGEQDFWEAPRTTVVNETFVRKYLTGNPIGSTFYFGTGDRPEPKDIIQVVGICKDAKYDSLKQPVPPTAYLPYSQHPGSLGQATFEVRSPLSPLSIGSAIQRIVADIDHTVPVANIRTQEEQIRMSIGLERLFAVLVGSFAVIAVLLAAIGLYGLMAYTVARRTAEIGIRLAIGASPGAVQRMVLRDGMSMVFIGMVVGIPTTLGLTRLLRGLLFGITPSDPVSFVVTGGLMLVVAAAAAWLPAWRAARVDPMRALRCE